MCGSFFEVSPNRTTFGRECWASKSKGGLPWMRMPLVHIRLRASVMQMGRTPAFGYLEGGLLCVIPLGEGNIEGRRYFSGSATGRKRC